MRSPAAILLVLVIFSACKVKYTLSGQSIPANAKTVSVGYFVNRAALANPTFSQIMTESLKDKFIRETKLQLTTGQADLEFSGSVTGYNVAPLAVQGNETAALNRLTVTISVTYNNNLDEKQNFNSSFSRFSDFPSNASLSSVEAQLIQDIVLQLTQDVFNKAFINW
jgi:hypothetical protein